MHIKIKLSTVQLDVLTGIILMCDRYSF